MKNSITNDANKLTNDTTTNTPDNHTWHFAIKKSRFVTGRNEEGAWQSWVGVELGGEFPYSQKDETIQKIIDEADILLEDEISKERDMH